MKVLINGADGQLGLELQQIKPAEVELTALDLAELDITDLYAVTTLIQQLQPDLIINAAAYTAVDKAEEEAEIAYRVNADGAANIAKAIVDSSIRLIHISTDFVFDGGKLAPYLPSDEAKPLSVYGASKLKGEQAVLTETMGKALILRTAWLYSTHGNNFVKTMLRLMAEKEVLEVVADQKGSPTWAKGLAKVIWLIADKSDMHGIYHWTDEGVASWYDFAVAIQEEAYKLGVLQRMIPIKPIKAEEYPAPAKRPAYSVLDTTSTCVELGCKPLHWRDSLREMLRQFKG